MKVWLFSWVRMLIVCTICIQLILLFVTEEQYRKYIRMFLHMLFLLILFRPILAFGDIGTQLQEELSDWTAKWEYKEAATGWGENTVSDKYLVENAVRQKLREDTEILLQELQLTLLDLDCSIRWEENAADITRMEISAAFENEQTGSPAAMEERVRERVMARYELSEEQIRVSVSQS